MKFTCHSVTGETNPSSKAVTKLILSKLSNPNLHQRIHQTESTTSKKVQKDSPKRSPFSMFQDPNIQKPNDPSIFLSKKSPKNILSSPWEVRSRRARRKAPAPESLTSCPRSSAPGHPRAPGWGSGGFGIGLQSGDFSGYSMRFSWLISDD